MRWPENVSAVTSLFTAIEILDLDQETADIYGRLKADLARHLNPKDTARQKGFNFYSLGMGDNDLWIAAVALRHSLTLVSADADLERIGRVAALRVEKWVSRGPKLMAKPLEDLPEALSPEQREQVRNFAESLLTQEPSPRRKPQFGWAGALEDLRDHYTSVELQHQISRWRIGGE